MIIKKLFYLSFPLPRTYGTISRVHMGGFDSQKKKRKERKKQEYLGFPTQAFPLFQASSHPKPTADSWGVLPVSEGWLPPAQKYFMGSSQLLLKSHQGTTLKYSFWLSGSGVDPKRCLMSSQVMLLLMTMLLVGLLATYFVARPEKISSERNC